MNWVQLQGPEHLSDQVPQQCGLCGCKDLYQQADFKRSVGVGLMIVASLLTCVFFALDYGWWTVWSPMFILLFVDLILRRITPLVAICYECGTVHRGIPSEKLQNFPSFDLETFDRIQYKRSQENPST